MIKECIAKLADGEIISGEEAYLTMEMIMAGEATPAQIAAFITALRIRGETPDVIAGCARGMREKCSPVTTKAEKVVDIVGTGGDGSHSFNISTTAAFVAAGAGLTVAKHGNRSVSSKCGAADVLTALGVNIAITPEQMSACLDEVGMAFLFAPAVHPAMKHAIGPRREIGIRTVFNILGPLTNPAAAQYGLLGVYSADLVPVMAQAAVDLDIRHLFVVHGRDGLDEMTTTAATLVHEIKGGSIHIYEFNPEEAGLKRAVPADLKGGNAEENASITRAILNGDKGPRRDIVCLNAGAAMVSAGLVASLKEGAAAAAEVIDSGKAARVLEALVRFTNN